VVAPTSMVHDRHTSGIQSERRDSTTPSTLDNPEAFNAPMLRMINDLVVVLREADADRTCRAVLLTGQGERERALN
jgi:enoyl-CoA hydratase/carnithine racemase